MGTTSGVSKPRLEKSCSLYHAPRQGKFSTKTTCMRTSVGNPLPSGYLPPRSQELDTDRDLDRTERGVQTHLNLFGRAVIYRQPTERVTSQVRSVTG